MMYVMIYLKIVKHTASSYFTNGYGFQFETSWNRWKCFTYAFLDALRVLQKQNKYIDYNENQVVVNYHLLAGKALRLLLLMVET
jgi:hypothetical protein